jgi:hypothetical protein
LSSSSIIGAAFAAIFSGLDVRLGRSVRDALIAGGLVYVLLTLGVGGHDGSLRLGNLFAEDMQGNAELQSALLLGFLLQGGIWIAPLVGILSFVGRTVNVTVRACLDAANAGCSND